jgi:hypothetical protein
MHRVVKLTARAPAVSESSIIDAIVGALTVGNCQDVLDRVKPKSLQELFEVMQEYCNSDKGRRRRLDRANAAKKQKQQGQWDQPKGWQNQPPKQANRQINNVSTPPDQNQHRGGGHKGGYKHNRGRSRSSTIRLSGPAVSGFFAGSMELMPSTTRTSVPRRSR